MGDAIGAHTYDSAHVKTARVARIFIIIIYFPVYYYGLSSVLFILCSVANAFIIIVLPAASKRN